jgi:hypothetical protein
MQPYYYQLVFGLKYPFSKKSGFKYLKNKLPCKTTKKITFVFLQQ